MDIELVTDDAYMMYIVSPLAGLGGGILWRPPAYSLSSLITVQNRVGYEGGPGWGGVSHGDAIHTAPWDMGRRNQPLSHDVC